MRNRIERSRYVQIALTYTRPLPMRIWAIAAAAYVLVILCLREMNQGPQTAVLVLGGAVAAWFGAMIPAHAKEQLADARAVLTPGFRGPHLIVPAVLFATVITALAALVVARAHAFNAQAASDDAWLPGYLALVLTMTALLAWMGHFQSPAAVFFVMLSVMPVVFAEGRAWLVAVLCGQAYRSAGALLIGSIAALAALWWRMGQMHEEMPEYARLMGPGFRLKVRMTGDPTFRRENRADAGPVESFVRQADRLDNVANVFAAPFWRRVRHWRLVIGIGRMPLFVAALLALTLVIQMVSGMRDTESRVVFPVVLSAIAPCMIVAGIWPRRWYVLAEESLRPVTRRRFILEQGAAMALEHAATWFYITAATFITALLIGTWTGPGPRLLMAVPVIAGGQVLIFGLIVWELRYRHAWLVIVPMILALSAAGAILVIGGMLAQYRHFGLMLLAGLILAAIGVAITFDAYRRWLTTEFD